MVIRFRILALGWLFFATSLLAQEKSRVLVPEVAPGQVGLSAEKLKLVDAAVDAIIEKKEIAGASVLIARKGKIAHFKTYGHQDLKAGKAMDRETIFRIYSMTKSIATSGALILHEEGKYQLDDPVEQYLPALARVRVMEGDQKVEPKRKMTVRDLMRHTAGMTYGFFGDTPVDALYREKKVLEGDMDQMVAKLGELPLVDHPGEKWVYSVSVDVLGKLIEVWSGQPFDVFLQKRIFEPLQMVDTAFHVPEAKLDRFAVNYGPGLSVIDDPATSQYRKKPSFLSGGGGLVSTARDYLHFLLMIQNGGKLGDQVLMQPATVALMTTNQLPESIKWIGVGDQRPGVGFGLGFSVRTGESAFDSGARLGEYGWGGAASTHYWVSPKDDLIVITMEQFMPYTFRTEFAIKKLVYDALVD